MLQRLDKLNAAWPTPDRALLRQGRERSIVCLPREAQLGRGIEQAALDHHRAIRVGAKLQMPQHTAVGRPDITQFDQRPGAVKLARHPCQQFESQGWRGGKRRQHVRLGASHDGRRLGCPSVALIGVCEQGALGEQLASPSSVERDIVAGCEMAHHPHPPLLDQEDPVCGIALAEQHSTCWYVQAAPGRE